MARDDAMFGWDGSHNHKIKVDHTTGTLVTVTHASHEEHEGHAYMCLYSVASIGGLDNDLMQLTWTTPDTDVELHMIKGAKCGATALFKFTEGWTGGGTATGTIPIYNRRRNSLNTSSVVVSYGTVAVTGGTALKTEYLSTGKFGAGETRDQNEWILKPNTKYAVSLFLNADETAEISLNWYEHI